jgi:hypothetical protein
MAVEKVTPPLMAVEDTTPLKVVEVLVSLTSVVVLEAEAVSFAEDCIKMD